MIGGFKGPGEFNNSIERHRVSDVLNGGQFLEESVRNELHKADTSASQGE
jgi:hypothetical protein